MSFTVGGVTYSGELAINRNGLVVPPERVQRIITTLRTADGTVIDLVQPLTDAQLRNSAVTVALDGTSLTALETIELGATSLAALESITATLSGTPTVELGATTLAALETIELGSSSLAALESITATLSGAPTVELGATSLAALETIDLGATTLAALETIELGSSTLAALEQTTATLAAGDNVAGRFKITDATGANVAAVDASGNLSLAAGGTIGSAVPTRGLQVGGSDGTNLRALRLDANGNLHARLVDSANADLTSAKGTQTTRFVGVQRSCDAGWTPWCAWAEAVAGATAATLVSLTVSTVPGTAGVAGTSYTVPAGKTLRIEHVLANFIATTTTANTARLRLVARTSGTLVAGDPVFFSLPRLGFETTTFVANESAAPIMVPVPDGVEFPAGTIIGITHQELAGNGTVDVAIFGFLY